jgi:hypothetical protein
MNYASLLSYNDSRFEIFTALEAEKLRPYNDGKGYVTIGVGYNLFEAAVRKAVLDYMGFEDEELLVPHERA